jgi:hypothetical protein
VLQPALELVVAGFRFWWDMIVIIWSPVLDFFAGIFNGIADVASGVFEWIGGAISESLEGWKLTWNGLTSFFSSLFDKIAAIYNRTLGPIISGIGEVASWGFDTAREEGQSVLGTGPASPQVVSPQERVARSVSETTNTSTVDLTVRDQTGRVQVTKPAKTPGVRLAVARSGAP